MQGPGHRSRHLRRPPSLHTSSQVRAVLNSSVSVVSSLSLEKPSTSGCEGSVGGLHPLPPGNALLLQLGHATQQAANLYAHQSGSTWLTTHSPPGPLSQPRPLAPSGHADGLGLVFMSSFD